MHHAAPNFVPMTNFERMLQLAEEVFAGQDDPDQLQVDEGVLARLQRLHPASRGEAVDGEGPIAWVLMIPTTSRLMEDFLQGDISEQDLFDRTPEGAVYEAIYLCSAMVLSEHRRKGLARKLMLEAIASIRRDHPISALFCWPFTGEGDALASTVAHGAGLPLLARAR